MELGNVHWPVSQGPGQMGETQYAHCHTDDNKVVKGMPMVLFKYSTVNAIGVRNALNSCYAGTSSAHCSIFLHIVKISVFWQHCCGGYLVNIALFTGYR